MASKIKQYDPDKVSQVLSALHREGKIDPARIQKIDSFIRTARSNATVRLQEHIKKGGPAFITVVSAEDHCRSYAHCMRTEFYCEEMNKLTIAAGLRCE